jgi:hypothetical protein
MSITRSRKKPFTINDAMNEDTENLYILTKATKFTGTPTEVLMSITSGANRDVIPVSVPMTFIPVNLSEYAPKSDVLASAEFRRMLHNGVFQLISEEEAEALLATPEAIIESQRLMANRQRRFRAADSADMQEDQSFKAALPPGSQLPQGAPGQVDEAMVGVSSAVVEAFAPGVEDAHRAVMLRNLEGTFTPEDKRYIRANTTDPAIRALVD